MVTQGKHAFSVLALGWYVSRFQRFCRFAAMKNRVVLWNKKRH